MVGVISSLSTVGAVYVVNRRAKNTPATLRVGMRQGLGAPRVLLPGRSRAGFEPFRGAAFAPFSPTRPNYPLAYRFRVNRKLIHESVPTMKNNSVAMALAKP